MDRIKRSSTKLDGTPTCCHWHQGGCGAKGSVLAAELQYVAPTVLLPCPPAGLQPVMTEAHGPLRVTAVMRDDMSFLSSLNQHDTHTVPASVVGGASMSGFCMEIGTFWGPSMLAPSALRSGCGLSLVAAGFHMKRFGLLLARGIVGPGTSALPEGVPLTTDATAEAAADAIDGGVGAARTVCERAMVQRATDNNVFIMTGAASDKYRGKLG